MLERMRAPTAPASARGRRAGATALPGGLIAALIADFLIAPACLATTISAQRGDPISAGQLTTSETCGSCHKDIFRMWKGSAHARSMEDTIFQEALRDTQSREGADASRLCVRCHAPTVEVSGDVELKQKITWEGVSCDFCHSLVSVELTPHGSKHVLDVGRVKRGPIRDAASMAHEVAYSELHTSALACAGCHEYVNSEGTPLITTYTEWKSGGAAAAGKSCQACHMGRTRAHVVDPRVGRVALAEVNLHDVPGGHSLDQLHKALGLTIQPRREGEELAIDIVVANKGAGHAVPTGMPGRRVILDVRVSTSGGQSFAERKIYSKVFRDAKGETITRDSRYFSKGVSLVSDTRIGPEEKRRESFRFPLPVAATAYITVSLNYEHAPTGGAENRTWLTFQSETRTVLPPTPGGD